MRTLYCLLILCFCCNAYGAELRVDQLFRWTEFKQFRVSPGGDLVSIWRYFEDNDEIIIAVPKADKHFTVFQMEESDITGVVWTGWIDADSLAIKYSDNLSLPHYLIVDFVKAPDGTVQFESKDVIVFGRIVDTLPEKQDRVLFSVLLAKKGMQDGIYEVDLREAGANNIFKNRLNSKLKSGKNFETDNQHRLRLATVKKKKKLEYVYFDLRDNQWKTYYSRVKDDEEDEEDDDDSDDDGEIFSPFGFINDSTIAVASNRDRDTVAVREFHLRSKKLGKVLYGDDRNDVTGAELHPKTGRLMMVRIMENGQTKYKYFTASEKTTIAKLEKAFPNKKIYLHSESSDGKKILVHVFSEANPGTYYLLDLDNAEARVLADVNPELEGVSLLLSESISVKSKDGLIIDGFVTLPRGDQTNHPLIVFPHGGPIGVRDVDFYNPEVQFLADRGFAVLRVNFRGSSGYGKSFMKNGVGQWGKGVEDDIDLSLKHTLQNYPIDKDKVCIMGASYGGYSALMSVIRSPNKYRCAISRVGVTDMDLILNQSNTRGVEEQRKGWQKVMGDPDDPEYKPKAVSPFYLADKIDVPVMLTAGWKDSTADPEHTHRLKTVLELLGKPHEYLLYKEGRHAHTDKGDHQHEMVLIERFLRKHMNIPYPTTDKDIEIVDLENAIVASEFGKGDIEYSRFYPKKRGKSSATKAPAKNPKSEPTKSEAAIQKNPDVSTSGSSKPDL